MPLRYAALLGAILACGCPPHDGGISPTFPAGSGGGSTSATATPPAVDNSGKELVRICVIAPKSGSAADVGAELLRGVDIAKAEFDARTDTNRRIEIEVRDTKSTEPGAVDGFQSCFRDGFSIVIGPAEPAGATALIPVAASHDAVLVLPEFGAAQAPLWKNNLFAVSPPATQLGTVAAAHAKKELGLGHGVVLHVPKVFGESLRDAFAAEFTRQGGTVLPAKELALNEPDAWGVAANAAVLAGADAIFVVGPPDAARSIAAALADGSAKKAHAFFIDWAMNPPVIEAAGEARSRVHWVNRPLPRGDFAETYRSRYQARPEYAAGSGYDAVKWAAQAADVAPSLWWEDVAVAMAATKGLASAFGAASVSKDGEIVYLDAAGYRLVDAKKLPDGTTWVFDGFE